MKTKIKVTVTTDTDGCIIATASHDGMTCTYDGDQYSVSGTSDQDQDVECADALRATAYDAQWAAFSATKS